MKILNDPVYFEDILDDDDRYNVEYDDDDIMFEYSVFKPKITNLPPGIDIWIRTDLSKTGPNRLSVKVLKDGQWSRTYSVDSLPRIIKDIDQTITSEEDIAIRIFIRSFITQIVALIDNEIDTADFAVYLKG